MGKSIWSGARFPRQRTSSTTGEQTSTDDSDPLSWRSVFQQDYDRLLFSTPVRRLSDKTQVWPMDENDGVRTRLTHSHEVANLARSIGSRVAHIDPEMFGADLGTVVQPILWAIGLAHDLGNPPFGHQGEVAIGSWFENRKEWIFSRTSESGKALANPVLEECHLEFLKFDGNPQTLRLITKLQTHVDHVGIDLTAATIAASLKYPVSAKNRDKSKPSIKKVGYFSSERDVVEWFRRETGLEETQRHPLTWIMEACDDVAYSILDVDDVMKKGVISPEDVLARMETSSATKCNDVVEKIAKAFAKAEVGSRHVSVTRDIKIGYMRAYLMEALLTEASDAFLKSKDAIFGFSDTQEPLLEGSTLCNFLKEIAQDHAFSYPSVLKAEAVGAVALDEILTFFWAAISDREKVDDITSRRRSPAAKFGWSLISPNYIEQAKRLATGSADCSSIRYAELRLLTDMVSGMTDTFAMKLWDDLKALPRC